ncbi:ankyrin repeat-containing domain protein [Xylaria bambusicola]|uniref:ankyrin repeat-containing domain protein n=1 Tax=Xylaria bambusicola TaxID=326684 RepID=UPI0020089638|nr:ankyrin repeat-containing domain protein [Xylaria bambusicola]KAI0506304.1 ankyrin repeat-containing domain protein [Xylaria bambusicola]
MAEALGIATGLIGASDVIIKAARSLTKFISDFRNAPKEVTKLKLELENLEAIIAAIQGYLRSSKATQQPLLASSPVGRAIQQCCDYMGNITDVLMSDNQKPINRSLWALKNKERCLDIVTEITRYTNLFHLALSLDGWELFFKSSLETTKALTQIHDDLKRVIDAIRPLQDMKNDLAEWEDHLLAIKEAIQFSSAIPATAHNLNHLDGKEKSLDFITKVKLEPKHRDVARVRHEDTCLWVQECGAFKKWFIENTEPCLWMHGIPGCGKTVIFSSMVDHLTQKQRGSDGLAIPVYFTYQDPTLHDVDVVFQAILRYAADFLYDKTSTREMLQDLRQQCRHPQERPLTLPECFDSLKSLVKPDTTLFLCFDGVDELPDVSQQRLLKGLSSLKMIIPKIKMIVSSRSNLNLRAIEHVELAVTASEGDLRLYLDSIVADIIDEIAADLTRPHADGLQRDIVDRIIKSSNGMFLLATLQVRQLRSAASLREILELSHSLPQEVDAQYLMYFDRVKTQPRNKIALNAIQWVSCAYRPLQVPELLEALSIRDGDSNLDPTGIVAINRIIQAAGGLLVLDIESNVVRLVHDSLRDYIDRNQERILGTPHFHILTTLATYLNFDAFDNKPGRVIPENWLDIELLKGDHKLLGYACCHWNHHLLSGAASGQSLGVQIVERTATSSALLRMATLARLGSVVSGLTPFDVAVLWENPTLASYIFSSGKVSLINQPSQRLTALHIAARFNNTPCAEISMRVYPGLAVKDYAGNTAIHNAALYGSEAVLRVYLEAVAKVGNLESIINRLDQPGWTPLHLALRNGHLNCAMLLLSHGADPNVTTVLGQTAVHLAIESCPSALPRLQEAGAIFGGLTKTARSALHIVCALGNIDADLRPVLETLDPNACDSDGVTPLHALAASRNPDIAAADWLISLGADINLSDKHHVSPLLASLREKNYQMAEYLLSKGARANCETSNGILPGLIAAGQESCPPQLVEVGFEQFRSRVLLAQGSKTAKTRRRATPLHLAVLLAPVHPRHSTIKPQRSNITSLLLQNHANPHDVSYNGFTPIHIAVIRDSTTILRQLLGASGSSIGKSRYLPDGTPLLAFSAVHSSPSCFKYLFEFAHQDHGGKLNPSHFIDILPLLLDYAEGVFSEDDLAGRIQTYRTELGLSLIPRGGVDRDTDTSLQQCSLGGTHRLPCTSFHNLCEKIVLLANFQNSKFPSTALHLLDRLKSWQSNHEKMAGISNASQLITEHRELASEAGYIGQVWHTGCRQDLVHALFALRWPEKASNGMSISKRRGRLRNHSEHGHHWEDSVALSSSSCEPHEDLGSSRFAARHGSIVATMAKRIPSRFTRSSIAGGLSQNELRAYDGARRNLLNPPTSPEEMKKSILGHIDKLKETLRLRDRYPIHEQEAQRRNSQRKGSKVFDIITDEELEPV